MSVAFVYGVKENKIKKIQVQLTKDNATTTNIYEFPKGKHI